MNSRKLLVALGAPLSLGLLVPTVANAQTPESSSNTTSACQNVLVDGSVEEGSDDGLLGGLLGDDGEGHDANQARASEDACLDASLEQSGSGFQGQGDDGDDDGLLGGLLSSDDGDGQDGDDDGLLGGLLSSDDGEGQEGDDDGLLGGLLSSDDGEGQEGDDDGLLGGLLSSDDGEGQDGDRLDGSATFNGDAEVDSNDESLLGL